MAIGILPRPGTELGPCKDRCIHRDCRATRTDAETACLFCSKAIGYDVPFYRAQLTGSLAHEACVAAALDRNERLGEFA